jgi:hypothetical protein
MERHKRTSASAHKNDLFGLPAPSSERRGPVKTGSEEARAWTGTKGTRPAQATGGRSDGKASVPSGLTWFAGIDDTAEDTPVRTYESYRQQHVLQTPSPAHGLRTETALGDSFGHNTEKEPVIMDAEQETEMETRMMEVKLQSLRSQLEMQRQTSAKLAKMCKENKEEYETCVQRMAAEAESQRIRAHVVEQELLKRIEALESAHHGKGAPKDKQEKSKYVSIHGFSSGNNRREAMRKEEYQEYLENDVARLKHKVADLTTKLSKANVKGVKAETQLEKARSEHRDAMNSMRQTQVELHDRIEDKDMLIQALRNESNTRIWGVDKIREQHRDLELDRARLQQECEQLRVAVTQHELDNAKLTEELQHVKHISKELESSNATLKARFEAEQKGACKELEDSIATLKAHLEAEKKRVQQVESCLVDARKGDNELLHENRLLSSRLATITFQYEELERAVKEMHSRFTEEEEREHKKMQMQHSENRSRIQTLESQLQASQVELKRTKTLLQAEVDTLKAKNSMIEETKASEQADSSRMRDALKTEIVLLHDQHRIELEERDRAHKIELEERDRAHRIELAEKDRGHKIELDERHRERERERLQENDQHRQQLENMKEDTRQMRADHEALLRKMQNAHEEGERKLRLAQEEISVARSEKELTAVRMSQVDGDHAVKMVGLQQEHHKRVDDLVAQVASRDARIHELNNEIRSLNEALQETKQHAVSVQAKSERHRQKAEDLQSKLSLEQESKTALQDASEAGRQRQQDLEAKLRLSEGQRSTLELSVLQMTKTISALSGQMNELEKRKNAESERASSLEVKLSLETDARLRAEELAVEAVRWKDERGQGSLETNEQTQSPQHEAGSEIMSLRKMVLHLESRIAEKSDSTEQREKEKLAVLQEQLSSYQEQAKQWEVLRHQLCTRVAQLEGTHIATSTRYIVTIISVQFKNVKRSIHNSASMYSDSSKTR